MVHSGIFQVGKESLNKMRAQVIYLGIIPLGMSSQVISSRSWDAQETAGFRRLVEDQCLAGEMAYRLGRTVEEIEAKAAELGLRVAREYETTFFVKRSVRAKESLSWSNGNISARPMTTFPAAQSR